MYTGIEFKRKGFVMVAYEFYFRLETGAEQLIGILPERRRDPERITRQSIMNWITKVLSDHSNTESNEIYFIRVNLNPEINGSNHYMAFGQSYRRSAVVEGSQTA